MALSNCPESKQQLSSTASSRPIVGIQNLKKSSSGCRWIIFDALKGPHLIVIFV